MEEINEKLHMELLNFDETKRKKWVQDRKPFSVLFELTPKCNMNCIHCYLHNKHMEEQLSTRQIMDIIDILHEKGILFLTLTGGEILTRSDFLDIYLYAKKRGFLVELFTNGLMFNDEIIAVLKEYPPLLVDISIYGACEETYYKITGVNGAFSRVVDNCRKLKDAGVRVALKSPIIKQTLPELDDMKKIAENIGIPFVYTFEICPTIDKDNTPQNYQVPLYVSLENEFNNYYEQINNGTRRDDEDNYDIVNELAMDERLYTCNVALNSFVIDYSGNMCPCMKLRHKGVSLLKHDYDTIWDEFKVYSNIIASKKYICRGCDARYYCDVCPAESDLMYNDPEYRCLEMCLPAKLKKEFYEKKKSLETVLKEAVDNKYYS